MIIKEALSELEFKNNPVAKVLHTGIAFNVIVLVLKKDMISVEKKSKVPTKLVLIDGKIYFDCLESKVNVNQYEELQIPVDTQYTLKAEENSICILIQGYRN